MKIDLNCDMGESFGAYKLGMDEEIIKYISSANIACGFHAGSPEVMEYTVKLAVKNGVAIGAHPGFPDLSGFGRRKLEMHLDDIKSILIYQIGALDAFAKSNGLELQHVKPHGALNNMAASDIKLAKAIGQAILEVNEKLIYVAPAGSCMYEAAKSLGLKVACEVFADRAYNSDGTLVSRSHPGAVISDPNVITQRVLKMITEGKITTIDGKDISIKPQTVCVHGDNPLAVEIVKNLRKDLEKNSVTITAMRNLIQ